MAPPREENLPSSTWHQGCFSSCHTGCTLVVTHPVSPEDGIPSPATPTFPHAGGPFPVTLPAWKLGLPGFAPGPPLELSPATCGQTSAPSSAICSRVCLLARPDSGPGGTEPARSALSLSPGLTRLSTRAKVVVVEEKRHLPPSRECCLLSQSASLEPGFSPFTRDSSIA